MKVLLISAITLLTATITNATIDLSSMEISCDLGGGSDCSLLGSMYKLKKDYFQASKFDKKAVKIHKVTCYSGSSIGCMYLALKYEMGVGTKKQIQSY